VPGIPNLPDDSAHETNSDLFSEIFTNYYRLRQIGYDCVCKSITYRSITPQKPGRGKQIEPVTAVME
jgi:hypothetical protein